MGVGRSCGEGMPCPPRFLTQQKGPGRVLINGALMEAPSLPGTGQAQVRLRARCAQPNPPGDAPRTIPGGGVLTPDQGLCLCVCEVGAPRPVLPPPACRLVSAFRVQSGHSQVSKPASSGPAEPAALETLRGQPHCSPARVP